MGGFINSHNPIYWLCISILRRKFMLAILKGLMSDTGVALRDWQQETSLLRFWLTSIVINTRVLCGLLLYEICLFFENEN